MDSLFTFMVNKITQLEKELAESRAETITRACPSANFKEENVMAQLKNLEQINKNQNLEIHNLNQSIKNQNMLSCEQNSEIIDLKKRIKCLPPQDYIHSDQNLDRLDDIIEKQETEIVQLNNQVQASNQIIKEQDETIEELDSHVEDLESEIEFLEARVEQIQRESLEGDLIIDKLEDTLEKYENQIVQLEKKIDMSNMLVNELETSNKEKEYQLLVLQARNQEQQQNPLEKIMQETFSSQLRRGLKLLFIYGSLQITGRFRNDPICDAKEWRMSLNITTESRFSELLEPYNYQLDDVDFPQAVKLIMQVASDINLYVGDYSPAVVEHTLNLMNTMQDMMDDVYMNVVTRDFIKRTPKNVKKFNWYSLTGTEKTYCLAIPRECGWNPSNVLKMFKHHIKLMY